MPKYWKVTHSEWIFHGKEKSEVKMGLISVAVFQEIFFKGKRNEILARSTAEGRNPLIIAGEIFAWSTAEEEIRLY